MQNKCGPILSVEQETIDAVKCNLTELTTMSANFVWSCLTFTGARVLFAWQFMGPRF